ncbi:MAG: competence/damage-inducible protein A [Desulfobacterales bacterium]|uniref:CinA-like protein n=1 Tax=Candidatus Desulfatibia vada TaxID=2841696 RepID=A0A8J6NR01_9BACT|nr:competence/damage-inducible protein A [Candidatus Desulfatibia vada]
MITEILATGQEIITGTVIDSNSAHIAQELEETGLEVVRHSCVGDDLDALVSILQEIGGRSDIGIVTGGLGPTSDDITAEAAAKAAGVELALDTKAFNAIEALFKARRRFMSPSNKKQAMLPAGSECLHNPVGTAPGFCLKIEQCMFFFLPGVPHEMERMLADVVMPRIEKIQGIDKDVRIVKTIATFGLGEAVTGERLDGFAAEFPDLILGIRAKLPEIQVKLYGRNKDGDSLGQLMEKASAWVLEKLGRYVFSVDGNAMEVIVGELLGQNKATLAVAESCTGGLISHWLTNVPGSSDYFLFSGVTYSNDTKIKILGVSAETINRCGAVHEETVKEMAEGARRIVGATYGLATSGIAGPAGGSADKPVGTVCIGLATDSSAEAYRFHFPFGNRLMKKKIFAIAALDVLRHKLQSC